MEVIKSKTANLYDAFKMAQSIKTAAANKGNKNASTAKISELDAINDPEECANIKALRRDFRARKLFSANNGSAYQNRTSN